MRRLAVFGALGAAFASAALGGLCAGVAMLVTVRWATRRVLVEGRSMVPALEPGDRLLVLRLPRRWPVRAGDIVALPDPRTSRRLLVKRVVAVWAGTVSVGGDNVAESTDSRDFGPVDRRDVWGRVCYRYAPASRAGRVRGRVAGRVRGRVRPATDHSGLRSRPTEGTASAQGRLDP